MIEISSGVASLRGAFDLKRLQRHMNRRRVLFRRLPKQVRRGMTVTFIFSAALNLFQLALPIFSMMVYDRVLPSGNSATLIILSAIVCLFLVSAALLDAVRAQLLVRLANLFEGHWRPQLITTSLDPAVPAWHVQGLLGDLDLIRNFITGPLLTALLDLPWSLLFVVAIAVLAPMLGGITLGGALLLIGVTIIGESCSRRASQEARLRGGRAQLLYETSIANRDTLRAMGGIDMTRRRLHVARDQAITSSSRQLDWLAWAGAGSRGLRNALQVAILTVAATLVLANQAPVGVIVASMMLFSRALSPFERVASGWRTVQAARQAADRLAALLVREAPPERRLSLPILRGRLEVTGLSGRHALGAPVSVNDVTFKLSPGEMLAVIGRSGSGKSTLARLLVGALHPAAGVVRLDGAALNDWNPEELGRQVGFLPQEPKFLDGTVAELIARSGPVDDALVVETAQRVGAHEFISRLPRGYQTVIGTSGHNLSCGERQRLGLARALYGGPAFVVLDEPTVGLDDPSERQLLTVLAELKSSGVTIVLVSRLKPFVLLADRVLMLECGRARLHVPRTTIDRHIEPSLAPPYPQRHGVLQVEQA